MKEDIEKCIWRANEFGEFETSALKINSQVATDEDKEEFIAILKDGQGIGKKVVTQRISIFSLKR